MGANKAKPKPKLRIVDAEILAAGILFLQKRRSKSGF
jgi:hypothetical protein